MALFEAARELAAGTVPANCVIGSEWFCSCGSVQRQERITKLMKMVHAEADFSAADLRQTESSIAN
jgi:hypothetical protein